MIKILTIKYRFFDKISKFIYKSGQYELNKYVVFKEKNEIGFGKVIAVDLVPNFEIDPEMQEATFRVANKKDWQTIKKIEIDESKALKEVRNQISSNNLNLKVFKVEFSFDKHKLRVFFSSDERVDFKVLLRILFKKFKILIEFKQVGVREVAKHLGGVGICGRIICCKSFLDSPKKITNESAVSQNIYLGGTKFCGSCGRLMCCLSYEEKTYAKLLKKFPKTGETVHTPKGLGIVVGVNVISESVKVSISDISSIYMTFNLSELSF